MAIMTEVLGHRREAFPQSKSEPLVKVIMRGNAVGNSLCITQENVTANFGNHYGLSIHWNDDTHSLHRLGHHQFDLSQVLDPR